MAKKLWMLSGVLSLCVVASAFAAEPATKPASAAAKATTKPAAIKPTTTPATRPAAKVKEQDPLRLAVAELTREAQAALQQKKPFPRSESDYFQDGNGVSMDGLIKTLGNRVHQNPRIDAYVKFQLLSAAQSFEGQQALDAMKAYVLGSPTLIALPGLTQQEQQKWNQKAITAKREDLDQINQEWNDALAPFIEANQIILAYRDLMRSKIQPPEETKHKFFQAYLEDLSQRAAAGFEMDKDFNAASKSILAWAQTAKKEQIKELQSALKEYIARKPPKFYEKLTWRNDKATWTYHYAGLPLTKVEKLQDELGTAMKNALE